MSSSNRNTQALNQYLWNSWTERDNLDHVKYQMIRAYSNFANAPVFVFYLKDLYPTKVNDYISTTAVNLDYYKNAQGYLFSLILRRNEEETGIGSEGIAACTSHKGHDDNVEFGEPETGATVNDSQVPPISSSDSVKKEKNQEELLEQQKQSPQEHVSLREATNQNRVEDLTKDETLLAGPKQKNEVNPFQQDAAQKLEQHNKIRGTQKLHFKLEDTAQDVEQYNKQQDQQQKELSEQQKDPLNAQNGHDETSVPRYDNVVLVSVFTTMSHFEASLSDPIAAAVMEQALLGKVYRDHVVMSMWHAFDPMYDDNRLKTSLPNPSALGRFFMRRTNFLLPTAPRELIIKAMCRLAKLSTQKTTDDEYRCSSYEVLVANDIDRFRELVEWASWPSREDFQMHVKDENVQQVDNLANLFSARPREVTFWEMDANPYLGTMAR